VHEELHDVGVVFDDQGFPHGAESIPRPYDKGGLWQGAAK
jgi:hypothetical protein